MALAEKLVNNFASVIGSPLSDTAWDKLDFEHNFKHVKIIVKTASTVALDVSLNGSDVHMSLPIPAATMNDMVYTFENINISRLYIRKLGASVEVYAYGVDQ